MTHYEGFDWSAVFTRSTAHGKTRALRHIRKYAVVGGPGWMGAVLTIFGPLTSIRTKHFDTADESKAWERIGGEAKPPNA